MKNVLSNKKLNLYLVVGIIFLLTFGVTYSFFTSSLEDYTPNQMVTETGTLELNYIDGDYIYEDYVQPGWEANKTMIITNIGTLDAYYKIYWKELTNEVERNELVLKAVCTSYEHYGEENQIISGRCDDIYEMPIANVASSIKENIGIEVGYTHVYSFTFTFKEMESLQNYNQGKRFGGVINIDDSYGLYTMNGTLLNAQGETLSNTLVSLSNGQSVITNENGKFVFEDLDEGTYSISVGETTSNLILQTGRELGASGSTITSNIENREINVTVQLGEDTVTYDVTSATEYDVKLLALYVDGVKVTSLDNNKNYSLISSACSNGETVIWDNTDKEISIKPMTTTTRCTINFNERNANILEKMISSSTLKSDSNVNFFNPARTIENSGLFFTTNLSMTEDANRDGIGDKVYYYRGVVENNYLIFAGFCWRIFRTSEYGGIKLRYGGIPTGNTCPRTAVRVNIGVSAFNINDSDNRYVGYMYGNTCDTYNNCHQNINRSTVKVLVDNWYRDNINNKGTSVTSKVVDAIYCNNRKISEVNSIGLPDLINTKTGYANNHTIYDSAGRLVSYDSWYADVNATPKYKCPQNNDKFTVSESIGNGDNIYPVGLLTFDELIYAGASNLYSNEYYFMNTSEYYRFMTPYLFNNNPEENFTGALTFGSDSAKVTDEIDVLPVITIKNEVSTSGTGLYNDPYVVQ